MPEKPGFRPTLKQKRLARALQHLRQEEGLSNAQVVELVDDFSTAKLSRIETAAQGVRVADVAALCRALHASDDVTEELLFLARTARSGGWWREYSELLGTATTWIEVEQEAIEQRSFTVDIVTGLLQSPAYYEAYIRTLRPHEDDEAIARRVEAREMRQKNALEGLELHVIIDESALLRPVGGHEVMASQLDHLVARADNMNISIRVLPLAVGAHSALAGPFNFYRLRGGFELVGLDDTAGGTYLDGNHEVGIYRWQWETLSNIALSCEHSLERLRALSRHHYHRSTTREHREFGVEEEHPKH